MDKNTDMRNKIDEAFDAFDAIQEVKVSPFFKDKTMNRLFAEKEVQQTTWSWFTPQLQLATLLCFIVLNVFAFRQYNSNTYNSNVTEFAESYGLKTTEATTSLFN
ncbi:hypothetical protein [Mariniflexile sp. AS56]|uniref:hypothetical protein n=1 Tax=Mariniflexile sp. AS56 TaxID=3063957 RepID=UPI0026F0BA61|nr:hypothetical protein [Mariniflexile sp. AS56]MDO7170669.1 hypothetical protein [Mariniflexile sp. AS56]